MGRWGETGRTEGIEGRGGKVGPAGSGPKEGGREEERGV
jgi:hypothetical protein